MEEYHFEVYPDNESITYIDNQCRGILEELKYSEIASFCLAAHELFINSVEGMKKRMSTEKIVPEVISVSLKASDEFAELEVIDNAGGIPENIYNSIGNMDFDDILLNENGRGLLLIKHLTDFFSYHMNNDGLAVYKVFKKGVGTMSNSINNSANISLNVTKFNKKNLIKVSGVLVYQTIVDAKKGLSGLEKNGEGYILDLSEIKQIDSTGFGLIINIAKSMDKKEQMVIIVTDENIRDLFNITKLDRLFPIVNSLKEADEFFEKNTFGRDLTVEEY